MSSSIANPPSSRKSTPVEQSCHFETPEFVFKATQLTVVFLENSDWIINAFGEGKYEGCQFRVEGVGVMNGKFDFSGTQGKARATFTTPEGNEYVSRVGTINMRVNKKAKTISGRFLFVASGLESPDVPFSGKLKVASDQPQAVIRPRVIEYQSGGALNWD
ncbi:hypothetical protein [Pseudomonas fluorescens]|uniref:Uncharacterized protein n=1 Tax=Pseudomonas fluorescens TaxID=294 RepID=A0A5E7K6P0_PSEFL|nr:hypothetical protein [Pseudomonas fluorescens]VVO96625.1 hypothetical protein PS880_02591 [Pseudomonas fluorescens]